ncbi:hypothetical protein NFJ02_30g75730 [Pycnococcus provasolii]
MGKGRGKGTGRGGFFGDAMEDAVDCAHQMACCACCLVILGPLFVIIGIAFLGAATNDTRGKLIKEYSGTVNLWKDTYYKQFDGINNITLAPQGCTVDSFLKSSPTDKDEWQGSDQKDWKDYTSLKYSSPSDVAVTTCGDFATPSPPPPPPPPPTGRRLKSEENLPRRVLATGSGSGTGTSATSKTDKRISVGTTRTLQLKVDGVSISYPNWAQDRTVTFYMNDAAIGCNGEGTSACESACKNEASHKGGTFKSYRPAGQNGYSCTFEAKEYAQSACLKIEKKSTQWAVNYLDGAGCYDVSVGGKTTFETGEYDSTPANMIPFEVRHANDPLISYMRLTKGGDFGLSTATKIAIGFVCLIIGVIIIGLEIMCCVAVQRMFFGDRRPESRPQGVQGAMYDFTGRYFGQPMGGGAPGYPAQQMAQYPPQYPQAQPQYPHAQPQYPHAQPQYPPPGMPMQGGYPPQGGGYPPQGGYPMQQPGYGGGYPPQQPQGYPAAPMGYPMK